jgi:hypothetical protein
MNSVNKTSQVLGVAFLLQFTTSFSSGVFLKQLWFVKGYIGETMVKIAQNPWLMRMSILLDMLTALGVIFLRAILFTTLRKQNEKLALTALGFYILEGALLAVSRTEAFSLLRFGQEYVAGGQPTALLLMGQVAYDAMDFVGGTLHMLAFCLAGSCSISYSTNHGQCLRLFRSGVLPPRSQCWSAPSRRYWATPSRSFLRSLCPL